jgi:hypothetical protein
MVSPGREGLAICAVRNKATGYRFNRSEYVK